MKYTKSLIYLLLLFVFTFPTNLLFSQITFEVIVEKQKMSKGDQMSYIIDIPQADLKTVNKNWIKLLQEETKQKVVISEHEIFIEGAMVSNVVQKPINIYSYVYEVDSLIRVISFYEIDSTFFEYSGSKDDIVGEKMYHGITNFKMKFGIEQYAIAVNEQLENEQKTLKTLQGDLQKLENDNQGLHKEIKKNEQNIAESNDEIKLLDADNERLLNTISAQRANISSISDKEQKKAAEKELKDLNSQKKKIGNKLEKEQSQIVEYEAVIKKCEEDIEKNLKLQEESKAEIVSQEEKIKSVENQLEGIEEIEKSLMDKIFH